MAVDGKIVNRGYRLYSPSWVDRLTEWVSQLPGSPWLYYVVLGLILFFMLLVLIWIEGGSPVQSTLILHTYHAGAIAFFLVLFHYLDKQANSALTSLRPALIVDKDEYQDIQYRITTLPAIPPVVASLAALGVVYLSEAILGAPPPEGLEIIPLSAGFHRFVYLLAWWFFGAFVYHTIHQLRLINLIYTKHTHVNLSQIKPLYAFSNLSALTSVCLAAIPHGWVLVNPVTEELYAEPVSIAVLLGITLLAVAAFVLPQLGIHRLQVAEKQRLIDEGNKRLMSTISELHHRLDNGEFKEIGELNTAMSGLAMELDTIKKIPTWPWEPETVRVLITALALPLGLWLVQFFLQRALSP